MKRFLLLLVLLSSIAFAVEPKEVGSASIELDFKWVFTGDVSGVKTFKTYSFPNTTFQTTQLYASKPYSIDRDDFGNEILSFEWTDGNEISLKVLAETNYDSPFASASPSDSAKFSRQTGLVDSDDSVATQASIIASGAENDFEKTARVAEWIHNNIVYDISFVDSNPPASEVFSLRKGVCNEYAHLGEAMLRELGIPSRFAAGWVYSGEKWDAHAWMEVLINGKWIPVDPTYNEAGILDGTHVLFAYAFDNSDVKESITSGLSVQRTESVKLLDWRKPRKFFSIALNAPDSVSSSQAVAIGVEVENLDSKQQFVPLRLLVPTQPAELEVKLAEPDDRLVFLNANEKKTVEWNAVFPSLGKGFVYSLPIAAIGLGQRVSKNVSGTPGSSPSEEKVIVSGLQSTQDDSSVTIIVSLSNAGNRASQATVSLVLGGVMQGQESVSIAAGGRAFVEFHVAKPLPSQEGAVSVSSSSGEFTQPFTITASSILPADVLLPGVPKSFDLELLAWAGVLVLALLVLLLFVKRG